MIIENVRNSVAIGPNKINMIVKFDHIDEEVPFTASSDDCMDYGRDLFERAMSGEFGVLGE